MTAIDFEQMTRSIQQRVSDAVSAALDEYLVRQALALARLEHWHEQRAEKPHTFYDVTRTPFGFNVCLYLPAEEQEQHGDDAHTFRQTEAPTLLDAVEQALSYLEPEAPA